MEPRYQNIIFDLDGTLIKSEEGLFDSITYALEQMGIEPGSREEMKKMIGPALGESFQRFYHMDTEETDRAVRFFQEAYGNDGIYKVSLFEGVEQMLRTLRDDGRNMVVATAKPQELAEIVLRYLGIDGYFQTVIGPDRSEKKTDKGSLITDALRFLAESGKTRETVMVGDRRFDIEAAGGTGIDSIGVLYGYGDRQELIRAGATWIAGTPEEVVKIIDGKSS